LRYFDCAKAFSFWVFANCCMWFYVLTLIVSYGVLQVVIFDGWSEMWHCWYERNRSSTRKDSRLNLNSC
jgi:hypothetical protein